MHGAALSDLATLSVARADYALAFGLAGPGLTLCHIRAGAGLTPPTSAPGLPRRFAFRRAQVLVANKMDLESDRRVALEQVWAFGLGRGLRSRVQGSELRGESCIGVAG